MTQSIDESQLREQLITLGVPRAGVLLVHTSYRAIRPIAGGPPALIRALTRALGPDGTLIMPSWSDDPLYEPASSPAAADLGVVADCFWRLPGVERNTHPQAFAAAGPHASYLLQDELPLPPHIPASPVGRVHDLDGWILLLGVNHDANTTIHLAECLAGVPYAVPKSCTVVRDGVPVHIPYLENDHCCRRFVLADDWLDSRGLQVRGPVGHGRARLMRSRAVVEVVLEELRRDPLVFLHAAGEGCEDCEEARRSLRTAPESGPPG